METKPRWTLILKFRMVDNHFEYQTIFAVTTRDHKCCQINQGLNL